MLKDSHPYGGTGKKISRIMKGPLPTLEVPCHQLCDLVMLLCERRPKRTLLSRTLQTDVRPMPKQDPHDVDETPRRRDIQRRKVALRPRVHIGRVFEQEPRDLGVSVDRREVQRRPAEGIRRVDLRAVLEEQADDLQLSAGRRSAQRGPPALI